MLISQTKAKIRKALFKGMTRCMEKNDLGFKNSVSSFETSKTFLTGHDITSQKQYTDTAV